MTKSKICKNKYCDKLKLQKGKYCKSCVEMHRIGYYSGRASQKK